ncbi:MAG: hypothetical protein KC636_17465, partial [Myxococcales bacterium]|nr:hypothetical protein [Myxococcales bacterium]
RETPPNEGSGARQPGEEGDATRAPDDAPAKPADAAPQESWGRGQPPLVEVHGPADAATEATDPDQGGDADEPSDQAPAEGDGPTSYDASADPAADEGWDFDFDALGTDFGDEAKGEGTGAAKGAAQDKGGAATDDDPEEPPEKPKKPKVKVGDVLGGSFRLTGAFLHFRDEPALFPNGDDALALGLGRLLVDADVGEHVSFDVNGFFELARTPGFGALSGAFASAGQTDSVYRTRYLTWRYWEDGSVRGSLGLDRAAVSFRAGPVRIDVGRFPVVYSVTTTFTPNDFYAPFSPTAVNRIYKPGVDGLRLAFAAGALTSVDVVGVLGYDDEGAPTWGRSSVLSRVGFVAGGFEWAALGGRVAERWVVGASAQGSAGPIGLRSEFHVGFPDEDGLGRGDDDKPIYVRVTGGPNVSFSWHNATLSADYMFVSDGRNDPGEYLERAAGLYRDDVPYLGKHYASAAFGLELIPILRASTYGIVNASDGSGLAGVALQYNAADEVDLIGGVFVPWGRGLRDVNLMAGTFTLGSEYGTAPVMAYLEMRVFF